MKKMIVRALALILALVLVGSLCLTAFAAETTGNSFNAGLSISTDHNGVITVTVSDDAETAAILADQKPTLAVVCGYSDVIVSDGTNELPFVIADGKVSFTVAATGSYTITPNFVASIEGENFYSLTDAFGAAASGSTVTLLKSVTIPAGTSVTVPTGVSLVIPEGSTLTVAGRLNLWGTLTNSGTIAGRENIYCLAHTDADTDGVCDICGFYAGGAVAGNTLTLEGDILQNYYATLQDPDGVYMEFTLPGSGTVKVSPVWDESKNMYVFSVGVAAKEMTDIVTGTLYGKGDIPGQSYTFSNRAYADVILNSDNPEYIAAQPMVRAMLHYGAYAQKHFGYNIGNLANAGIGDSGIDAVSYTDLSAYARPTTRNISTIRFVGASMILESNTTLRLFFRVSSDVTPVFTHNGQVLAVKQRDGNHYVDIPGIRASDLDTNYTVDFTDGTNSGSVTYNPMTYCYTILKSTSYADSLKDLVKAMFLYNQEANALFEN